LSSYLKIGINLGFKFFAINLCFIVAQLFLVTIYFSIKNREIVWLPDKLLGWGDIVFFIAISWLFALGWFLVFYTGALIFSLVFSLVLGFGRNGSTETVPLATGLSVALIFMLLFGKIFNINFYDFDFMMLNFL